MMKAGFPWFTYGYVHRQRSDRTDSRVGGFARVQHYQRSDRTDSRVGGFARVQPIDRVFGIRDHRAFGPLPTLVAEGHCAKRYDQYP